MDVLYRVGSATAADVHQVLSNPPSYSAVRAMLRVLEEKGHIRHEEKELRYIYFPVVSREKAKRSALSHLLATFFEGSPEQAVATLLDVSARRISEEELGRIAAMIEKARREGR
jgi:BlaI family transcriptional regulator, penicillinase repressor